MKIKEDEHFIPGAIPAMMRLNIAMGKSEAACDPKVTVSTHDLKLVLSSTKKISEELLRYRVTTKTQRDETPDPLKGDRAREAAFAAERAKGN